LLLTETTQTRQEYNRNVKNSKKKSDLTFCVMGKPMKHQDLEPYLYPEFNKIWDMDPDGSEPWL
jgi:hypothetical protein